MPYPAGVSDQEIAGRKVTLRIPAAPPGERRWGLVLSLGGTLEDLGRLAEDEYVVCRATPRIDARGTMWSAGEVKELWGLVAHLGKVLPIDSGRLHAVGLEQGIHTIFGATAFGDGSRFVSATFFRSHHRGGAVAARAKKEMGVLAFQWTPDHGEGTGSLPDQLGGKVRSLELREDPDGLAGPYFPWWVRTMEGLVVAGDDLSFAWMSDLESGEQLKAQQGATPRGAFLWVFSKEDAASKGGRALQLETFLDERVRKAGRALLAVKLDRATRAAWSTALGVKTTPTLVVLGKNGAETARFEGEIKTAAFAKSLEAAAK